MATRALYLGPLTDNRRWDEVDLRPDDVLVVTPPKCGTTWMQTIVGLLLTGDPEFEPELAVRMPWVDFRLREMRDVARRLDAMTERRCLKSHTPMDGLPLDAHAQYLCVFRHPLDAHLSYRRHLANIPLSWFDLWYPEEDEEGVTMRRFLDGGAEGFDADAMPLAFIIRHFKTAMHRARHPNVSLFHYADMVRDLPGTFDRVAGLLGVNRSSDEMERLVPVARFDRMKAEAARFAPGGGTGFLRSDTAFFDSGSHGKWVGVLTDAELAAYDAAMDAHLTVEERAWLEFGSAGAPEGVTGSARG